MRRDGSVGEGVESREGLSVGGAMALGCLGGAGCVGALFLACEGIWRPST